MTTGYRLQFGNMGWRGKVGAIVAAALGLAAAIVLVVLSLGLALILIPIVAVGYFIARWRFRKVFETVRREAERPAAGNPSEIDYTVVDDDRGR